MPPTWSREGRGASIEGSTGLSAARAHGVGRTSRRLRRARRDRRVGTVVAVAVLAPLRQRGSRCGVGRLSRGNRPVGAARRARPRADNSAPRGPGASCLRGSDASVRQICRESLVRSFSDGEEFLGLVLLDDLAAVMKITRSAPARAKPSSGFANHRRPSRASRPGRRALPDHLGASAEVGCRKHDLGQQSAGQLPRAADGTRAGRDISALLGDATRSSSDWQSPRVSLGIFSQDRARVSCRGCGCGRVEGLDHHADFAADRLVY